MKRRLGRLLRRVLRAFGLDVTSFKTRPDETLLGLIHLPIRTIIDVGANRGQFARRISGKFPRAKIYSIEPLPGPYAALESWAAGESGRIVPIRCAVGAESGAVTMNLHTDHPASSSILATTDVVTTLYPKTQAQREISVEQKTLDQIMESHPIEGDLLIKMDVQGYEDRVIAGGKKALERARACIAEIGLAQLYHGQATFEGLTAQMSQLGFRYAGNLHQVYADDGSCVYLDALYLRGSQRDGRSA